MIALLGWPAPAVAHHLMGGRLPATAAEGLLSRLAHPVIGIDHFLTVLLMGALCARLPKGMLVAAVFLVGALGGTEIHLLRVIVPAPEALVAVSLIAVAALLFAGRRLGLGPSSPSPPPAACSTATPMAKRSWAPSLRPCLPTLWASR